MRAKCKWRLRRMIVIAIFAGLVTQAQGQKNNQNKVPIKKGYAPVNGLNMYYEIHGTGRSLVLIHGGGSTITTTFGEVVSLFAKTRQVIAVEMQAHGHTMDIDRALSFEQDADDIAALLKYLQVTSTDIFGFSNGGSTAMQLSIRHPNLVRKVIVGSSFYKREGIYPEVWSFIQQGTLDNMPQPLKDAYLKINNDQSGLSNMHDKDRQRMLDFKDWPAEALKSIQAHTLLLIGDRDVVRPEHAVEMYRLIPNARIVILPSGHGDYIGEIMSRRKNNHQPEFTVNMIDEFLNEPAIDKN
jgi:pimeloyl-ACP methyl ester carboxylesterase